MHSRNARVVPSVLLLLLPCSLDGHAEEDEDEEEAGMSRPAACWGDTEEVTIDADVSADRQTGGTLPTGAPLSRNPHPGLRRRFCAPSGVVVALTRSTSHLHIPLWQGTSVDGGRR